MTDPASLPVVWAEAYEADIGPHVFPTSKYRLVLECLLEEGPVTREDVVRPEPATEDQLARIHDGEYLRKIREDDLSPMEEWRLEVPFNDAFREASILCAGGSVLAGRLAMERGLSFHLGGGFHHAFADHGEGFCLLNDVAVGLAALLAEDRVARAAVVDCDVHHGNGTASLFADEPRVFTFSMHQEHNYPALKPPSDLDVGLDDRTGDQEYLQLLRAHLPAVLEEHGPEVIFYLAGADPYREDQLGGLSLTIEGLRQRDEAVLELAGDAGIPVAILPAGGYSVRLQDTVEIHCNTARAAARCAVGSERA